MLSTTTGYASARYARGESRIANQNNGRPIARNQPSFTTCVQIVPVEPPSAACDAAIVVETAIRMPKPSKPADASSNSCTDAYGRSRNLAPSDGGNSFARTRCSASIM